MFSMASHAINNTHSHEADATHSPTPLFGVLTILTCCAAEATRNLGHAFTVPLCCDRAADHPLDSSDHLHCMLTRVIWRTLTCSGGTKCSTQQCVPNTSTVTCSGCTIVAASSS